MADQATNIAKKARKLNRAPLLDEVQLIKPMFTLATEMFRDAIAAFVNREQKRALSIKLRDKELDQLNLKASDCFTKSMAKFPERIPDYLNLILIARHLERVGDHAKNMAEEVVFAISAEDIRHLGSGRYSFPGSISR